MQKYFDDNLAGFKEKLLTMGSYAESAVSLAVQALTERNDNLARQVQENDDIMDQFEIDIDDMAINLLAKAPLATDLRLITVAMKNFSKPGAGWRRGHHHFPARDGVKPGTGAQGLRRYPAYGGVGYCDAQGSPRRLCQ